MQTLPLSDLRPCQSGVVEGYDIDNATTERLRELGLVRGTLVSVTRLAPLGDPMELSVRGYALSIRLEDASRIRVRRTA